MLKLVILAAWQTHFIDPHRKSTMSKKANVTTG